MNPVERADQLKKQEEERRRQAESIARNAAKQNPSPMSFKDFANFPEDYLGRCVQFQRVYLHGGLTRNAEHGVFAVMVSSDDGKMVMNFTLVGSGPGFVVSERFGRSLDIHFATDKKYVVNIWCEVEKHQDTILAKIYRVEALNVLRDVVEVYDDPNFAPTETDNSEPEDVNPAPANPATPEPAPTEPAAVPAPSTPDRPIGPNIGEGETLTNSIGMKFCLIPSGTFMMGSPASEAGRDGGEVLRYAWKRLGMVFRRLSGLSTRW